MSEETSPNTNASARGVVGEAHLTTTRAKSANRRRLANRLLTEF